MELYKSFFTSVDLCKPEFFYSVQHSMLPKSSDYTSYDRLCRPFKPQLCIALNLTPFINTNHLRTHIFINLGDRVSFSNSCSISNSKNLVIVNFWYISQSFIRA